jgi:hypothetical protein
MNYRHFASAFAELMEVELGLAVNLKTFREVLREVSIDGRNWWLASNVRDAVRDGFVRVGYRDLPGTELLNTIYFRIALFRGPVPSARRNQVFLMFNAWSCTCDQPGLYLEADGAVNHDDMEDFVSFFSPLKKALIDRM